MGSRNRGIDLLRGISILLVVVHHVGLRIPLKSTALAQVVPRRLLRSLTSNGYEAVFLFFVLSGFLITTNSLRRWHSLSSVDARAFYARRFARIVPCLLALVLVLSVLHLLRVKDYVITHPNQSLARAILSALGLHLNWYEGRTGYLPGGWDVLWSLSIEETFYLAFPLLCLTLRREDLFATALLLLALSLPMARAALAGNEVWQEKAYLPGMAGIAAGVLGALVAHRSSPPPWQVSVLGMTGAAGVAAVLLQEDILWSLLGNGTMLLLTFSAAGLVVACHWMEAEGRSPFARGTRWLRSCGRWSYEIYLTHMFVVFATVRAFRAAGEMRTGFLWYVPAVVLSWALGALVARLFSAPADHWLRELLGGVEDLPVALSSVPEGPRPAGL